MFQDAATPAAHGHGRCAGDVVVGLDGREGNRAGTGQSSQSPARDLIKQAGFLTLTRSVDLGCVSVITQHAPTTANWTCHRYNIVIGCIHQVFHANSE